LEVLYGGAAGGGKSDALLMSALRYVDTPGYSALILRRSYADLSLPGAIMDRAWDWLRPAIHWDDKAKTFRFGSGATLTFGYLETEVDKYRYQGAEFQFVAFDELTQFTETQYRYLFSRLRKGRDQAIPLRMRAASNPGGVGHDWVRSRFIDAVDPSRAFVPARLHDNPHLDAAEYERSLAALHPVERARLRDGDWNAVYEGGFFKREWLPIVERAPAEARRCRSWDKAATAGGGDWTAGVKIAEAQGLWYVEHVVRGQWSGPDREAVIRQTAALDGPETVIVVEQEPGSGGKDSAQHTVRALAGFAVYAEPVTGEKTSRAKPLAAQAAAGNVRLVRGPWNAAFLDELLAFPAGTNDDQVDAAAGGFNHLSRYYSAGAW